MLFRSYGLDNVIILTARMRSQPINQVLIDFSLPKIFVAAVGSSDPITKANYVIKTIDEEEYERVIVYEDNIKNIAAIRSVVEPILGKKNFIAFNVRQENGVHTLVKH